MVPLLALPEGGEWIILLVVVVFLFGANKLPDLTRNAARALVEFKKITNGKDDEHTAHAGSPVSAADPKTETPAKPEGGSLPG
jgi:sec-independent protein translocase protein TatA